jgi:hypothetical protein
MKVLAGNFAHFKATILRLFSIARLVIAKRQRCFFFHGGVIKILMVGI